MKHLLLSLALLAIGAAPGTPTIHMKDDAFTPKTLTVHAGTTVLFVNEDDDAHTVTAVDGTFDSKGLDTNGTWRHRFTKPGTYKIFCELHPFMRATIVVAGGK
jgi:plastocyanin